MCGSIVVHCRSRNCPKRCFQELALISNVQVDHATIIQVPEICPCNGDWIFAEYWSFRGINMPQKWGLVRELHSRCKREHTLHTHLDIHSSGFMGRRLAQNLSLVVVVPVSTDISFEHQNQADKRVISRGWGVYFIKATVVEIRWSEIVHLQRVVSCERRKIVSLSTIAYRNFHPLSAEYIPRVGRDTGHQGRSNWQCSSCQSQKREGSDFLQLGKVTRLLTFCRFDAAF